MKNERGTKGGGGELTGARVFLILFDRHRRNLNYEEEFEGVQRPGFNALDNVVGSFREAVGGHETLRNFAGTWNKLNSVVRPFIKS